MLSRSKAFLLSVQLLKKQIETDTASNKEHASTCIVLRTPCLEKFDDLSSIGCLCLGRALLECQQLLNAWKHHDASEYDGCDQKGSGNRQRDPLFGIAVCGSASDEEVKDTERHNEGPALVEDILEDRKRGRRADSVRCW